jgi:hypothetical protein
MYTYVFIPISIDKKLMYFSIDNAHLCITHTPDFFDIPFDVQTRGACACGARARMCARARCLLHITIIATREHSHTSDIYKNRNIELKQSPANITTVN